MLGVVFYLGSNDVATIYSLSHYHAHGDLSMHAWLAYTSSHFSKPSRNFCRCLLSYLPSYFQPSGIDMALAVAMLYLPDVLEFMGLLGIELLCLWRAKVVVEVVTNGP